MLNEIQTTLYMRYDIDLLVEYMSPSFKYTSKTIFIETILNFYRGIGNVNISPV